MLRFLVDLHTHSIASGHAYSTIEEMARAAKRKGMRVIAITDHGVTMTGAPKIIYFKQLFLLPEKISSVTILKGAEANVIYSSGRVDIW